MCCKLPKEADSDLFSSWKGLVFCSKNEMFEEMERVHTLISSSLGFFSTSPCEGNRKWCWAVALSCSALSPCHPQSRGCSCHSELRVSRTHRSQVCTALRLGVRGGDGAGAAPGAAPVSVQVCKRHLGVRGGLVRERFLGGFCSLV